MSGGFGRDRIVALDADRGVEIKGPGGRASFAPVSEVLYDDKLPIAYLTVGGHTRGYPLSILASHEIVNDVIEGLPVLATYCPLCNTALAFERTVAGRVLDFGVAGLLRHADLIMFDRQTESWWQQVTGEAIAGVFASTSLKPLAMPVLSYRGFAAAFPAADILTTDTGFSYRYDLRQASATYMLSEGISLRVVMEVLGHSTINVTANIYGHVMPDATRDAADKVGALLLGAS